MMELNKKKIVSFSGGKDSTAMLIYLLNNKIDFDEIIYVKDFFPYPGIIFDYYLNYIEKRLNVNIKKLDCNYKTEVKKNNIFPSGRISFCSRIKAEIIKNYLKNKHGKDVKIRFFIGVRKDESKKRKNYNKSGKWYWNERFHVDWSYSYPIFDFTEKEVFNYLKKNNVKINPLYEILNTSRLGCAICHNSKKDDLRKFYKAFPEQFNEFLNFEKEMNEIRSGIKTLPKFSLKDLKNDFKSQKSIKTFLDDETLNECQIKKNLHLFPAIEYDLISKSATQKTDLLLNILHVQMPDIFYSLKKNKKAEILNKKFPNFIKNLSLIQKQYLCFFEKKFNEIKRFKLIETLRPKIIQASNSLLNPSLISKILESNNLPKNYFETSKYKDQVKEMNELIRINEKKLIKKGYIYY